MRSATRSSAASPRTWPAASRIALGYKVHWTLPDYLQRSARHIASKTDLEQARAVGKAAVRVRAEGHERDDAGDRAHVRRAVSLEDRRRRRWTGSPTTRRRCPRTSSARMAIGITAAARRYLEPLIRGEAYPTYGRDGLPKYVALRNRMAMETLPDWRSSQEPQREILPTPLGRRAMSRYRARQGTGITDELRKDACRVVGNAIVWLRLFGGSRTGRPAPPAATSATRPTDSTACCRVDANSIVTLRRRTDEFQGSKHGDLFGLRLHTSLIRDGVVVVSAGRTVSVRSSMGIGHAAAATLGNLSLLPRRYLQVRDRQVPGRTD